MGETELATTAWKKASDLAPSWATPHLETARALSAAGRTKDAIAEANESDNSFPASGAKTVDVRVVPTVGIRFVPIAVANATRQAIRSRSEGPARCSMRAAS